MSPDIPEAFGQRVLRAGIEATRWLATLPALIADLERAWGLSIGPAFDHGGTVSWVAPVALGDGGEAVLKISMPHADAHLEAEALRFVEGRGAVRLLRASEDGQCLLLERCRPGTDLRSLSGEEADAVACRILPRLWREPDPGGPFLRLPDLVAAWWDDLPNITRGARYDAALVARAVALGRRLAASASRSVLLHGDLHPGNILAAQREPWLLIDPKPVMGEPAYDLAQWLLNSYFAATASPDPVGVLRLQIDRLGVALGLEPARIAGWTLVKALGWDWGPDVLTFFDRVAQAWSKVLARDVSGGLRHGR